MVFGAFYGIIRFAMVFGSLWLFCNGSRGSKRVLWDYTISFFNLPWKPAYTMRRCIKFYIYIIKIAFNPCGTLEL